MFGDWGQGMGMGEGTVCILMVFWYYIYPGHGRSVIKMLGQKGNYSYRGCVF